jgi:GDP-L-fucose synthase
MRVPFTPSRSFWEGKRVLVTGAGGFVGRNLVPLLEQARCELLLPARRDHDLTEQLAVRRLLTQAQPDVVVHLAGLVGGILANDRHPADFYYQNLIMGTLMLEEAWRAGAHKYVTLIGGCSYPATAPSPIAEDRLWDGYPQRESAPYSLAKRMAVVGAEAYRRQHGFDAIVLVPGNLYGPLESSHVIPALIRRFWEARRDGAREVTAWGTGRPLRDFVYVEDACRGILRATESYGSPEIVNISSGTRVAIRELVETIAGLVGYRGRIVWDTTKPDGQLDKGFDVTRMKTWLRHECPTPLVEGLRKTLDWFVANYALARLKAGP